VLSLARGATAVGESRHVHASAQGRVYRKHTQQSPFCIVVRAKAFPTTTHRVSSRRHRKSRWHCAYFSGRVPETSRCQLPCIRQQLVTSAQPQRQPINTATTLSCDTVVVCMFLAQYRATSTIVFTIRDIARPAMSYDASPRCTCRHPCMPPDVHIDGASYHAVMLCTVT
jgi:hypothetical protein